MFEGFASPGMRVALISGQRPLGHAITGADGVWKVAVSEGLGRGDHRIVARSDATTADSGAAFDSVRISIPAGFSAPAIVVVTGDLAIASSAGGAAANEIQVRINDKTVSVPGSVRLAQLQLPGSPSPSSPAPVVSGSLVAPVLDWMQRAREDYQEHIVRKLSHGDTARDDASTRPPPAASTTVIAQTTQPPAAPLPKPSVATSASAPTEASIIDSIQHWMKKANDDYQGAIVKRLMGPAGDTQAADAARLADEARKAADAKAGTDALNKAREDLRSAQAKRDEELKRIEAERAGGKPTTAAAKVADDAEARRLADDKRIADETLKRQADLQAAEERRAADAKRTADEIAKRQADAAATAAKNLAERVAEDRRTAETAAKRLADLRAAEEKREADAKRLAGDAAKKQAEEARLAQDAAARAAMEAKRIAEQQIAETARLAAAAEVARRTAAEEATRQAAAVQAAKQSAAALAAKQQAAVADAAAAVEAKRLADAAKAAEASKRAEVIAADAAAKAAKAAEVKQQQRAARLAEGAAKIVIAAPLPKSETPKRIAETVPPARTPAPIDRHSRSSLGAGIGTRIPKAAVFTATKNCSGAGQKIKPPGTYVVQRGDTLWDIADLHYDDGARYTVLERANADRLDDPNVIRPCQKLHVPKLSR